MENYFWFAFLVILLIVISIVIFRDLKKWNFSDEYKLFHRVYSEYKSEVLGGVGKRTNLTRSIRNRGMIHDCQNLRSLNRSSQSLISPKITEGGKYSE